MGTRHRRVYREFSSRKERLIIYEANRLRSIQGLAQFCKWFLILLSHDDLVSNTCKRNVNLCDICRVIHNGSTYKRMIETLEILKPLKNAFTNTNQERTRNARKRARKMAIVQAMLKCVGGVLHAIKIHIVEVPIGNCMDLRRVAHDLRVGRVEGP